VEAAVNSATTPYAVADWWYRYILPPGSVLLAPFCGSGTMLAAGLDAGATKVIGIDKKAKYLKKVREGWRRLP
jgi:DNA modification methylase